MLRHIVMFKTREYDEKKKAEVLSLLKDAIDRLKDQVPEVKFLQTGININTRPQAYDLVLVSDFESEEDLDLYREHPQHQRVMEIIREVIDRVHVVDFMI